jgi:predicted transcriptional regulator of viral defense system
MKNGNTLENALISKLERSGVEVFSLKRASALLDCTMPATSQVLHRLANRGRLRRIQKATYILVPEGMSPDSYTLEAPLLASALTHPYYLSYWTALHYYGWTEQPSNTVFIATTRLKKPIRVSGVTFKFIKLKPSRFFGATAYQSNGHRIRVADKEKTIVDCLDQPRYCGEIVEAAKGIWNGRKELDFRKIQAYARRMDNRAIIKRLGFMMETLDVGTRKFRESLKSDVSAGYSPLEPGLKKGKYNKDWHLFVNVSEYNLTEWRQH